MSNIIPFAILVFLLLMLILYLANCYRKVGPNEVLVITGGCLTGPYVQESKTTHTKVKIIKGGGAFVVPIIQQARVQSLDIFHIDVEIEDVQTKDSVPINVKANATLRVGSSPAMIAVASEKMLGLVPEDRNLQMTDIVKGGVRDVITKLTPKEANDREKFQAEVVKSCEPIFSNLGLEITNLNITDVYDNNGYYKALAAPEIAQKNAEAKKAQAKAEKEATEAQAENQQKAEIAKLNAENEIAAKRKEVNVAKAQYDAETRKAEAVADKAQDIANAEQDRILQEKQIAVEKNKLKATIVTKQEAENEAQKQKADADYYVAKQKADADAYAIAKNGKAQQEKITSIGKANADAQRAMAGALSEQGSEQSLASKIIDILPEIAKENAKQLSNIKKLTVLNGSKGLNEVSNSSLATALETIKNTTGIDITELVKKRADGTVSINGDIPIKNQSREDAKITDNTAKPKEVETQKIDKSKNEKDYLGF